MIGFERALHWFLIQVVLLVLRAALLVTFPLGYAGFWVLDGPDKAREAAGLLWGVIRRGF